MVHCKPERYLKVRSLTLPSSIRVHVRHQFWPPLLPGLLDQAPCAARVLCACVVMRFQNADTERDLAILRHLQLRTKGQLGDERVDERLRFRLQAEPALKERNRHATGGILDVCTLWELFARHLSKPTTLRATVRSTPPKHVHTAVTCSLCRFSRLTGSKARWAYSESANSLIRDLRQPAFNPQSGVLSAIRLQKEFHARSTFLPLLPFFSCTFFCGIERTHEEFGMSSESMTRVISSSLWTCST